MMFTFLCGSPKFYCGRLVGDRCSRRIIEITYGENTVRENIYQLNICNESVRYFDLFTLLD